MNPVILIDCQCTKANGVPDPDCRKCGGSGVVPINQRTFTIILQNLHQ